MTTLESQKTAQTGAEHSTFDDIVDVRRFYPGGKRQEILDELLATLAGAVPIATLTGDEGSGKTMVCRMVEERVPARYVTVFFSRAVDSFEDIVRTVAGQLEVEPAAPVGDLPGLLQAIAATLQEREARLLLIFDEAECIYLASLERVRKMLDQVNAGGLLLQIVLSGRIGLHKNFKHLALCRFQEVEEKHFVLDSLSFEETFDYLNHAIQHGAQADRHRSITREEAEKIFAGSCGNFRQTKVLAKDSFMAPGADTSFMALLDNVQEVERKKQPRRRLKAAQPKTFRLRKRHLAWGGGVVCAALVAFLLLRPSQNHDLTSVESPRETGNKIVISQAESVDRIAEEEKTVGTTPPAPPQKVQDSEKQPSVAPAETIEPAVAVTEKPVAPAEPVTAESVVPPEKASPAGSENEKAVAPPDTVQSAQQEKVETAQPVATAQPTGTEKEQPVAPVVATTQPVEPEKKTGRDPVASGRETEPEQEKSAAVVETAQPLKPRKEKPAATSTEIAQTVEAGDETPARSGQVAQPAAPEKDEEATKAVETRPAALEQEAEPPAPPPIETIEAREIVKHRDLPVADAVAKTPETVPSIRQEESKIAEIKLNKPAKIKADIAREQPGQLQQPAPVVRKVEAPKVVKEAPAAVVPETPAVKKEAAASQKPEDGNRIYSRRVAAGTPWLLGLKDDRYTVQLMVVTGSEDEKKLKEMLTGESFKGQASKVYILKKESAPDVQYVFFGEYKTMTEARNARNTIPKSLRDYKPYAMSVKGAVKKVQEDE